MLRLARFCTGMLPKKAARDFVAVLLQATVTLHKAPCDIAKEWIKNGVHSMRYRFGKGSVEGVRNAARYARQRIGIPAQRYGISYGVFKVFGIQKRSYRLWNCSLGGDIKGVCGTNLINGPSKVVSETVLNAVLDFILGFACAGQEYSGGNSLSALDSLGMVVGNGCELRGFPQHLFEGIAGKASRTDAHGRPVTPAVVGLGIQAACPAMKAAAIAAVGISVIKTLHVFRVRCTGQDGVRQGNGQDGIVRESGSR